MGYAINDQTNSLSSIHSLKGSWTLNLPSNGSSSGGTGGGGGGSSGDDGDDDEVEDPETEDDPSELDTRLMAKRHFTLNACSNPSSNTAGSGGTAQEDSALQLLSNLTTGLAITLAFLM